MRVHEKTVGRVGVEPYAEAAIFGRVSGSRRSNFITRHFTAESARNLLQAGKLHNEYLGKSGESPPVTAARLLVVSASERQVFSVMRRRVEVWDVGDVVHRAHGAHGWRGGGILPASYLEMRTSDVAELLCLHLCDG